MNLSRFGLETSTEGNSVTVLGKLPCNNGVKQLLEALVRHPAYKGALSLEDLGGPGDPVPSNLEAVGRLDVPAPFAVKVRLSGPEVRLTVTGDATWHKVVLGFFESILEMAPPATVSPTSASAPSFEQPAPETPVASASPEHPAPSGKEVRSASAELEAFVRADVKDTGKGSKKVTPDMIASLGGIPKDLILSNGDILKIRFDRTYVVIRPTK